MWRIFAMSEVEIHCISLRHYFINHLNIINDYGQDTNSAK